VSMMLTPDQAHDLLMFLDDCGTHWPQGPDAEATKRALEWHADGPGGAFLDTSMCGIALKHVGPAGHRHTIHDVLHEKLKAGAAMAHHGNAGPAA
jgi:hypothetical protein